MLYLVPAVADNDIVANAWSTVQIVSVLVGTLIPILTALVTRWNASPGVKAVTNLVLSAIAGFGAEFIKADNAGQEFYWQGALLTTIVTFVVSVATYYGLWKPTNVAGADSSAARAGGFIGGKAA